MVVSQNKTLHFFSGQEFNLGISKPASIELKPYLKAFIFQFLIIVVKTLAVLQRIEVHFRTIISMDPLNRPQNVSNAGGGGSGGRSKKVASNRLKIRQRITQE